MPFAAAIIGLVVDIRHHRLDIGEFSARERVRIAQRRDRGNAACDQPGQQRMPWSPWRPGARMRFIGNPSY
jgi:hypothetical protein